MMHSIGLVAKQPLHKFKLCGRCDGMKPPEGGIDMGMKWHCQSCWNKKITGKNLKQNRFVKNAQES